MLPRDGKYSNNSRVAQSQAAANENKHKLWTKKQRKKLRLPSEGLGYTRTSLEIPSPPLPALKWGLGRGGSWLHPFWSLSCIALHTPELPWVGPALPPGAQSLILAVTQHFHYTGQSKYFSLIFSCLFIYKMIVPEGNLFQYSRHTLILWEAEPGNFAK